MMKKTSLPNSVESLGYIKCYSSSSARPVKSPSNSIRRSAVNRVKPVNLQLNHTGNQKKGDIYLGDQQSYYLQVL